MKRDFVFYALFTATAKGLQFLLLPLLTRLFSPADYGFIDLVSTLTALLTILMSLSMESAVARMWFDAEATGRTARLLSSAILFVSLYGTLLSLALWVASDFIAAVLMGKPEAAAIIKSAVVTALAMAVSGLPQIALRMELKVLQFGLLQLLQSALGIALSLLLMLQYRLELFGFFLGIFFSALIVLALGMVWVRNHLTWKLSMRQLRECLDYGLPLTPAVFINWANGQADRFILLSLLGLGVVGVYGAAAKVATIITVLVEIFRLAWLPAAMRRLDNESARNVFFNFTLTGYLAVMCSVGLLLVAYSRELLLTLTSSDYAASYVSIPWLIGAQILYGSASITNVGMLANKKTGGNSVAAAIGAVLNIGLGLVLVAAFGLPGSAIGSFLSAFVFTALLMMLSVRQTNIRFNVPVAFGLVFVFVLSSAGVLWLYRAEGSNTLVARSGLLVIAIATLWVASARSIRQDANAMQTQHLPTAVPNP